MPSRLALVFVALGTLAAAAVGGFVAGRESTPAPVVETASLPEAAPAIAPPETAPLIPPTATPAPRADRPAPAATKESNTTVARSSRRAESEPAPRAVASRVSEPAPVSAAPPAAIETPRVPDAPPAAVVPLPEPMPLPTAIADRVEPPSLPAPIEPVPVELVVAADSVVGLRITNTITTETAQIEDNVEARVVRDVRVGGDIAIPSGTRARGSVTVVERGGRFKERARIGVRFHTLVFPDNTEVPVSTETLFRLGDSPGNASATKVGGGAVVGAILGAIIGGGTGAAIGAASGAGAGTAAVMASDVSEASFPAGTEVTARLLAPVSVVIEP